ncbi:MAG: OsmC family protein [Planctomycetota bacterium]|jgi:uncharacterized OsmC-like protein
MPDQLKTTFERNAKAVRLRPSAGQGTAVTRVRLRDRVGCEVEDGKWKLRVDMSEGSGGNGAAPDPGVFGRAALGSCLSVAYSLWAAKLEVPIDDLTVEIHADYDSRGMYGVGDVAADYRDIRYLVTIRSPAPDEEIEAMMREAEEHCIYLNVFTRARELRREVRIER